MNGDCDETEDTVQQESEDCEVGCCKLTLNSTQALEWLYKGSDETPESSPPWIEKDGNPGQTSPSEIADLPVLVQEGVTVHGECNNWSVLNTI